MANAEVKHGMPCPVCKTDLMMTERQGVEIDYCPRCRGVWLDRGELDKIIERSAGFEAQPGAGAAAAMGGPMRDAPPPFAQAEAERYRRDDDDRRYRRDDDDRYRYRRDDDDDKYKYGRKRRGWLGDMFDFD